MKSIDFLERPRLGKGGARSERRANRIPCEVYGLDLPNLSGSLCHRAFEVIKSADLYCVPFQLNVKDAPCMVICRAVQWHPVTNEPMHIDLLRVADAPVLARVPIDFQNMENCPAIKAKATLHVMLRYVMVKASNAKNLPAKAVLDMSDVQSGQILHTQDLVFDKEIVVTDMGKTVAKLIPARVKAS